MHKHRGLSSGVRTSVSSLNTSETYYVFIFYYYYFNCWVEGGRARKRGKESV